MWFSNSRGELCKFPLDPMSTYDLIFIIWCWQVSGKIFMSHWWYMNSIHLKMCIFIIFIRKQNTSFSPMLRILGLPPFSICCYKDIIISCLEMYNTLFSLPLFPFLLLFSVLHRAKRTINNINQIIPLLCSNLSHATHALRTPTHFMSPAPWTPFRLCYLTSISDSLFSSKMILLLLSFFLKHPGLILALWHIH